MYKRYEQYKPSDCDWFDDIPLHWNVKKFSKFTKYINRGSTPEYSPKGIMVINQATFSKGIWDISDVRYTSARLEGNKGRVEKDDVLIASTGGGILGKVYYFYEDGEYIADSHVTIIRANEFTNAKFLYYTLKPKYEIINAVLAKGSTNQTELQKQWLKDFLIPAPRKKEQEQIVRFLDWKTKEISHYVKEKRKELNKLGELKNSLIFEAVTKGINRNLETKDSSIGWIGKIPKHWEEIMLFQCTSEQKYSNKLVHHQNLLSLSYGKIVSKDINTTEGLLPASFDTYQVIQDGNIILRLTDLQNDHRSLRVGIATQEGIITSAYTCLKTRKNVLPMFLYLMLHSYDVSKVFYGLGGGVRQSIGFADIRRIIIPLPSIEEQKTIVEFCIQKKEEIENKINNIQNEVKLFEELRNKLISDAVTGKIDVRNIRIPEYQIESEETDTETEENNEIEDYKD